jgi:hypothetical protein
VPDLPQAYNPYYPSKCLDFWKKKSLSLSN